MNSEIEFRAKRKDNNEFVYGYLVYDENKNPFISKEVERFNYDEEDDLYAIQWYEVIPETIGQYTGLTDKNGKKIFEGDILREYSNEIEDWEVSYEYGKFVGNYDNICEDLWEIHDMEVIGTIFDKEDNNE